MKKKRGTLFVISGPAGSGKGTVVKELISAHDEIALSVSATTRQPRCRLAERQHLYFHPGSLIMKGRRRQ